MSATRDVGRTADGDDIVTLTRESRSRRRRENLDAADVRLIELLIQDGRMSSRALAREVGLTEATVAARMRSLFDRRILGVTATLDWRAAGYDWDAWFEVQVAGRSVTAVGEEMAALEGVHAVYVLLGPVDLLVHVLLPSSDDAVDFINERITGLAGVHTVRPNVTLETKKYTTHFARLPVKSRSVQFPAATVELDDIDRQLIDALIADGRRSNRDIARQLQVSEGTVRMRLRRLETAGLLRIVGQTDPFLTGLVSAWAFVGVDVETGLLRDVAATLRDMPEVAIVAIAAGRHDILLMVVAHSRTRLVELVVDEIRTLAGVRATETWEVVQTLGLNYQFARLL